jgi:hypothetical protein
MLAAPLQFFSATVPQPLSGSVIMLAVSVTSLLDVNYLGTNVGAVMAVSTSVLIIYRALTESDPDSSFTWQMTASTTQSYIVQLT